jgi:hypothetical protein
MPACWKCEAVTAAPAKLDRGTDALRFAGVTAGNSVALLMWRQLARPAHMDTAAFARACRESIAFNLFRTIEQAIGALTIAASLSFQLPKFLVGKSGVPQIGSSEC